MKNVYVIICICLMTAIQVTAQPASPDNVLTARQQHIVRIASCTGRGDLETLKPVLAAGLDQGLTVNEIREVLIHAYAYCGFPRSLRALQTFIAVLDERKTQGIEDTVGKDASPVKDDRSRYDRGRDILAEISGVPADAPKAGYAEFAPVIERFLKEHLFADLFERDVLTYSERELATVSVIAALGESVMPMLRGHMAICRNLGMTEEQLNQARPKLATHIQNLKDYNVVFVGFPNWWYDMPMPLYSFFEEYDFSGKTIIPFCTHGGSRFSDAIKTIRELEKNATVLDGYAISRDRVTDSKERVLK